MVELWHISAPAVTFPFFLNFTWKYSSKKSGIQKVDVSSIKAFVFFYVRNDECMDFEKPFTEIV